MDKMKLLCLMLAAALIIALAFLLIPGRKSRTVLDYHLQPHTSAPVVFNQEIYLMAEDNPGSLPLRKASKYEEGVVLGTGKSGLAYVSLNGQRGYVPWSALTMTQSQKNILDQEKEQERREEEARLALEQKHKEELERLQKKQIESADFQEEQELIEIIALETWDGSVLNKKDGVNEGPSGKETYYNLPMEGVISIMRSIGNNDEYWVRSDGVKMLGNYVMVAAHLGLRPRGSLINTSLGMGIVCDTGDFAMDNPTQLDIAVDWKN